MLWGVLPTINLNTKGEREAWQTANRFADGTPVLITRGKYYGQLGKVCGYEKLSSATYTSQGLYQ